MAPEIDLGASSLLRLDLVRRHWRAYCLIAIATVVIHLAWIAIIGIAPSTDFAVRYDPGARELLSWMGLGEPADSSLQSQLGAFGWSRIGYIGFVAVCYQWFGTSLASVIYPQVVLVWLVYPLMFHVLLHITGRPVLSLGAMGIWMTFYDGYQWHFWAVPDSLYRLIFVTAFFLLLRLWETRRGAGFVCATLTAVAIGTVFRIETALYAIPALWLSLGIVRRTHPVAVLVGLAASVAALWAARRFLMDVFQVFVYLQAKGFVLPGSGHDIPGLTSLAPPVDGSWWTWAFYFGRLFFSRLWYATTPLPALWSTSHRVYYALYAVPAYVLALVGTAHALRHRDRRFLVCLWIFAAGVLLQGLVAVDPSLRYAYTSTVFWFFCATMGWPVMRRAVAARADGFQ